MMLKLSTTKHALRSIFLRLSYRLSNFSFKSKTRNILYHPPFLEKGLVFCAFESDDFGKMYRAGTLDRWELDEVSAFSEDSGQANVVLDCGAYVGIYSLIALETNSQVRVISVEPNPYISRVLRRNLAKYGQRSIRLPYALGNQNKMQNLFLPVNNYLTSSGTFERDDQAKDKFIWRKKIRVRMTTIDELVSTNTIPAPDLIKIDCENSELNILFGAKRLLTQHKPIVYFEALSEVQYSEIESYLKNFGYTILRAGYPGNLNSLNFIARVSADN